MKYSILIPVYNYNVSELAGELLNQMASLNMEGEVILLDDCSTDSKLKSDNKSLNQYHQIKVIELEQNVGRSKARNLLVSEAKSSNLIFLDADVLILDKEFLVRYTSYFDQHILVVGGHQYQSKQPEQNFRLNWNYATTREVKRAKTRLLNPYQGFISMNFYCDKTILERIPFPEFITRWGHEDTYLGHLLEQNDIPIDHINNRVFHKGLYSNKSYILKQEIAIQQAIEIIHVDPSFNFKLTSTVKKLPRIIRCISKIKSRIFISLIRKLTLKTCSPFLLNLYKFMYYIIRK